MVATPTVAGLAAAVSVMAAAAGTDLVTVIVTGLLTGGIGTGIGALIVGRANARKASAEAHALDAKLPAEVDSVIVQGAEAAVLTMQAALNSATARIVALEAERAEDHKRILALERRASDLQGKVDSAERSVTAARDASTELRRQLDDLVRARDRDAGR